MSREQCKTVLMFNARKKLIGICASVYEAAKMSRCLPGNVSRACTGDLISIGNLYFRYIPNDITVSFADLNKLKLEEYDQRCGIKRRLYSTQCMNRKNWKYSKKSEN